MKVITFSGLDGCGKSTQAELTCDYLARRGLRVYRLTTLLTSVAGALTLLREAGQRRAATRGDSSDEHKRHLPRLRTYPNGRTFDQDRRRRLVIWRRRLAYPIDCAAMTIWLGIVRLRGYDVVVCDRYIYDKMVNLPDPDCILSRVMRILTPTPTCAVFLDTPPGVARTRRDEHTDDYYHAKYAGYQHVSRMGVGFQTIPCTTVTGTQDEVQKAIERRLKVDG